VHVIIGHVGLAFVARSRDRRAPFAWLLVATMAPDLLRLMLTALGVMRGYENRYSHLLPWSALVAAALGMFAWLILRNGRTAMLVAALVLSHIGLDAVSGQKALWDGGPAGLNLQDYQQLEFVIEAGILWWGWWLLRRSESPWWPTRRRVLTALLAVEAVYLAWSLSQRPYATRCLEYPVQPCWIRRHDRLPV